MRSALLRASHRFVRRRIVKMIVANHPNTTAVTPNNTNTPDFMAAAMGESGFPKHDAQAAATLGAPTTANAAIAANARRLTSSPGRVASG